MKFNAILQQFEAAFKSKYAGRILPSIHRAINALLCCKTEAAGQFKLQCSDCEQLSLGNSQEIIYQYCAGFLFVFKA